MWFDTILPELIIRNLNNFYLKEGERKNLFCDCETFTKRMTKNYYTDATYRLKVKIAVIVVTEMIKNMSRSVWCCICTINHMTVSNCERRSNLKVRNMVNWLRVLFNFSRGISDWYQANRKRTRTSLVTIIQLGREYEIILEDDTWKSIRLC